eukprot:4765090-Amphidinium_carterae.1
MDKPPMLESAVAMAWQARRSPVKTRMASKRRVESHKHVAFPGLNGVKEVFLEEFEDLLIRNFAEQRNHRSVFAAVDWPNVYHSTWLGKLDPSLSWRFHGKTRIPSDPKPVIVI